MFKKLRYSKEAPYFKTDVCNIKTTYQQLLRSLNFCDHDVDHDLLEISSVDLRSRTFRHFDFPYDLLKISHQDDLYYKEHRKYFENDFSK